MLSLRHLALCALGLSWAIAYAQPVSPTYFSSFGDAVTRDNAYFEGGKRYWSVDPGTDSYQNDFYERPTVQSYAMNGGA